jgi:hypothetical protein
MGAVSAIFGLFNTKVEPCRKFPEPSSFTKMEAALITAPCNSTVFAAVPAESTSSSAIGFDAPILPVATPPPKN